MQRLRRSVRSRWISPGLMLRHRIRGAEFFRASFTRNRGIACSKMLLQNSEPPSRASKRLSVRTSKRKDQASKLPRNSSFSADENAPLVERSSTESHRTSGVQSGEGAGASTSATTAPTQVAGGPALLAKAKRREKLPTSRDDFRAKPLPDDQASAMGTDSPATLPSWRDAQSPEGRKRTIMARYVFGNELKPGERWKRRLLTSR